MNLSPQQLEELGRQYLGEERLQKAKEHKEDALNIYNHYQKISGIASGATPKLQDVINRQTGISLSQSFQNPLKPSIERLPQTARERAELVKTSSVLQKEGLQKAIKRMETNSPNYILDTDLSTDEYIIARNRRTGKIEIAFRGTDPEAKIKSGFGKGLPEPVMWADILATGQEGKRFNQHNLEEILEKIKTKYTVDEIGHISGYSMGGTKAHRLGDMIGVDTTLLNPFVGKNFFSKPNSPNARHQVYRTTEDIASAQGFLRKELPPNVRVASIDPIAVLTKRPTSPLEDVVALHDLDHFVEEGNRASEVREANDIINERVDKYLEERQGLTREQQRILQDEMLLELEPQYNIVAGHTEKFKARTGVMKSVIGLSKGLAGAGAGFGAGIATNEALKEMGIENPYISETVAGASAGLAGEKIIQKLGGLTSLANLRSAVLTGGVSALSQTATADLLNKALVNAGVDRDTAGIISESSGGAVGGASSVAIPMALQRASTLVAQNTSRVVASAVPELAGTELAELSVPLLEETALEVGAEVATETALEVGAEVATETALEVGAEALAETALVATTATNWWNPIGWIAGATLLGTAIAGGIRIAQAINSPKVDYVLHPTRNEAIDNIIANDETIKRLINDFNDAGRFDEVAIKNLEDRINFQIVQMPRVPLDYGYRARLIPAPRGQTSHQGVIYPQDYNKIPAEIRSMNGAEYQRAVGDAKLYNEYPMEYHHLTDTQKQHIIDEIIEKNPEFANDRDFRENPNLNYKLARALELDTENTTGVERREIIEADFERHRAEERQQEAIQKGLQEYSERVALTNEAHRLFSEFLHTDPKVREFLDKGDINGLNVYLHSAIYNPNIAGRIFNQLSSEDRQMKQSILENNLPQVDELGNISFIKIGDAPREISVKQNEHIMYEARASHLNNKYLASRDSLHSTGILRDEEIVDMMNKGADPEDVNSAIKRYVETHPVYKNQLATGNAVVPQYSSDGTVNMLRARPPEEDRQEHITRRQQIHAQPPPEPVMTES